MAESQMKRILGALFAFVFCYVFVTSGLIVSLLCLLLLTLWPCGAAARNLYRRISSVLAYSILSQIVWVSIDWADVKVHLFGEDDTFIRFGKEPSLITCSHRGDLDWIAGYITAVHFNFLHTIRTLPKRSVLYVPGFGQILWAIECPFLQRNFEKDQISIAKVSEVYKTYPFPPQVAIFCEGTRFTAEKHRKGLAYSKEKGIPEFKHHLVPRTKGFALLAEHLKSGAKFPAVYDVAFSYPTWPYKYIPTHLHLLLGYEVDIYFYVRRIPMEELPSTHEELNAYCYKMFQIKDNAYDYYVKNKVFPGKRHQLPPLGNKLRILRSIMLFWIFLLVILPTVVLLLTMSWSSLFWVFGGVSAVNITLLLGMLTYAYGGRITIQDDPSPTAETDSNKKTD